MAKANRYTGVILFLFSLYYSYEATRVPLMTPVGPGAGAVPLVAGICFGALSLALILQNLPGRGDQGDAPDFRRALTAAKVLLGFFGVVLLAKTLGMLIVILLFMAFHTLVVVRVPWKKAVAASLAVTLAFYLVFEVWLGVPMIVGVLGI